MAAPSFRTFSLSDVIQLGTQLRSCADGATTSESAGRAVVRCVHDAFVDESGLRETVLVRYYQTMPYDDLDAELQAFASAQLTEDPWPGLPCLTLLGTAGIEPVWNDRRASQGHRAIPLPSTEAVAKSPMIAQLISQLGLELTSLISPDPDLIVDLDQKQYNVFHVAVALGSPHIPAQDAFVVPYGVRSALGFGGMLPSGDMFAVVLFSRVPIARESADLFRTVALSVKVGMLPVMGRLFDRADDPA
ncbi:MAG TPA: hypothetical protein VNA14_04055 [Mycobacteriales bacterium]|nr:hypothetical protein [Mycobacteriales bacterium]